MRFLKLGSFHQTTPPGPIRGYLEPFFYFSNFSPNNSSFKMIPRLPGHRGVADYQCPGCRGVKNPGCLGDQGVENLWCPGHWGVENLWCPGHQGVILKLKLLRENSLKMKMALRYF